MTSTRNLIEGTLMTTSILHVVHLSAAALLAVACTNSSQSAPPAPTTPASGDVAIRVDENGFTPSTVSAPKGKPLALVFTRTPDHTCAKAVAFPDLKLEKPLPKNTPVRIEVPTEATRTYAFQCGMGMFNSKVVVQ